MGAQLTSVPYVGHKRFPYRLPPKGWKGSCFSLLLEADAKLQTNEWFITDSRSVSFCPTASEPRKQSKRDRKQTNKCAPPTTAEKAKLALLQPLQWTWIALSISLPTASELTRTGAACCSNRKKCPCGSSGDLTHALGSCKRGYRPFDKAGERLWAWIAHWEFNFGEVNNLIMSRFRKSRWNFSICTTDNCQLELLLITWAHKRQLAVCFYRFKASFFSSFRDGSKSEPVIHRRLSITFFLQ